MKSRVFGERNLKEMVRDPISYLFCLGFPLVMLVIMTIVDQGIPKQAQMEIFKIPFLAPGIAVFGFCFIMIFNCIQVAKDRSTAFLIRLYISPMKPMEYILGYTIPLIPLAYIQATICFLASIILGAITGNQLEVQNLFFCYVALLPSVILFIAFGMLFGTLLSEKAAPGASSIIISVAGMIGGIWMDVDSMGAGFKNVCKVLPFYHGVKAARMALGGNLEDIATPLLIVTVYAVILMIIAALVFKVKMQKDLK